MTALAPESDEFVVGAVTQVPLPDSDLPLREAQLRQRLTPPMPSHGWRGWSGPIGVTLLAFLLRIWHISTPKAFGFDETYYAKDALSLLRYGYEREPEAKADEHFLAGSRDVFLDRAEWATHPPLGKWVIGIGEAIFGIDPFGYRIMSVVFGTLAVLVLARTVRRMTRSDLLGTVAGLLLAIDGLELVMSRLSMLDIFLMGFVLFAFGCLVVDRDRVRKRLLEFALDNITVLPLPNSTYGPRLGLRPWRLAAGLFLGMACATKWSGVYYLIAFGIMSLFWDRSARRAAGIRWSFTATAVRNLIPASLSIGVVAFVTYLASYAGWIFTKGGYLRDWATANGRTSDYEWIPAVIRSLWHWHADTYDYHVHLTSHHNYEAGPHQWMELARPTQVYAPDVKCGAQDCIRDIVALGNPAIWWAGCLALVYCSWIFITRRDWRVGAALLGVGAGWLPWFWNIERTTFTTYAVIYVPFLVMCVTFAVAAVLGSERSSPTRRTWGAAAAGGYVLVAVASAAAFYPVWTAELITKDRWCQLMLFRSWI